MNLTIFNRLMKGTEIKCHPPEWKMFLEVCDLYLKQKKIKDPIVVEVGLKEDSRQEFFKQLFNAEIKHVVYQDKIDILLVGGGSYEDIKKNFEVFSPNCKGIIVIHDIESCRYKSRKASQSWKFWDELKALTACGKKEYENFLFITIHQKRIRGNQRGIGVIIKQ